MTSNQRPKCQAFVQTYGPEKGHRCYHIAKIVVEGKNLCRIHAKVAVKQFEAAL